MRLVFILLFGLILFANPVFAQNELSLAIEFNSHAAAFYVALDKGFFDRENLKIKSLESYLTGVALASSLKKGSVEAAYMCLHPAISTYANGGVKLKVVSGTHLYGYGLVVNPRKIKTVKELEKIGIKIGCVREGSGTDLVMQKTLEMYGLDKNRVLSSVIRMNPPNMLIALRSGSVDAAFLPEHFLTLAERDGFHVLISAKDVWPNFQGSGIVVKEEILKNKKEEVKKLVSATEKAIEWINSHKREAATILSRYLSLEASGSGFGEKIDPKANIRIDDTQVFRSFSRIDYTTKVKKEMVQEIIDFMAKQGYLKERFGAEKILSLVF